MLAFLSYNHIERHIAAKVKALLESLGFTVFMAHEDIDASEQWRLAILDSLRRCHVFVAILSDNYFKSVWCSQEAGIAGFRRGLTIIPLSIDTTIPIGAIAHIQSVRIDPNDIPISKLLPGLFKTDRAGVIDGLINLLGTARNYATAEQHIAPLSPYLAVASEQQHLKLLTVSMSNDQVLFANRCSQIIKPYVVRYFGRLTPREQARARHAFGTEDFPPTPSIAQL